MATTSNPASRARVLALPANHHVEEHGCVDVALRDGTTDITHGLLRELRSGQWQALAELRGPFTVIGSSRALAGVFLARDHIGQRPLFYSVLPDRVVASSYLPAVLEHPEVDDTVDSEALALQYARCFHALRERTIFRHVRQVPPGTVVVIGERSIRHHQFWDPHGVGPPSTDPLPQRAQDLRYLLSKVVAEYSRTPSGGVAAHVSGGLDSTAVAAFADNALRSRGQGLAAAYSWAPAPDRIPLDPEYDERRFLMAICGQRGWEPTYAPDLTDVPQIADPLRSPTMAWFHERRVVADAHARGVTVMLTGWGGDEAISGHGKLRVAELLRRGHWATAVREVNWWAPDPRSRVRTLTRAARLIARQSSLLTPTATHGHLNDQLHDLWGDHWPIVADALQDKWAAHRNARTVRDWQLTQLTNGHIAARNASWFQGGLPYGVEHRSPLQDPRVVEFALRSDSRCFQHHGWRRVMFRLAVAPVVPPEVAWRIGKDDRIHRHDLMATVPPPADPQDPRLQSITELARRQQELSRQATLRREGHFR